LLNIIVPPVEPLTTRSLSSISGDQNFTEVEGFFWCAHGARNIAIAYCVFLDTLAVYRRVLRQFRHRSRRLNVNPAVLTGRSGAVNSIPSAPEARWVPAQESIDALKECGDEAQKATFHIARARIPLQPLPCRRFSGLGSKKMEAGKGYSITAIVLSSSTIV
jgi:hypothetical protein